MAEDTDYSKSASEKEITQEEPAEEIVEEVKETVTEEEVTPGEPGEETPEDSENPEEDQDYKKMFLDTKKAYTKAQMELAELKGKTAALEEVSSQRQVETEEDWLDKVDDDELRADPSNVKKLIKKIRAENIEVMRMRDAWLLEQIEKQSPELLVLKEQIAALKSDSDYEGFSDKQLAVVARKGSKAKPKKARGAPGGKRVSVAKEVDVRKSPLYQKMYGDEFKEQEKKNDN